MDIKIEPEDDDLSCNSSENAYNDPNQRNNMNDNWNQGHSTVGRYKQRVKEEIDEDDDQHVKKYEVPIDNWKVINEKDYDDSQNDIKNIPIDTYTVKKERFDEGECSYAEKLSGEQSTTHVNLPSLTQSDLPSIKHIKKEGLNCARFEGNIFDNSVIKEQNFSVKTAPSLSEEIKKKQQTNNVKTKDKQIIDKSFRCDQCDYKSMQYSRLMTHQLSHTNDELVDDSKTNKKSHIGVKVLNCEECDFKTTLPSHLKTHKMCHSGEKPFKCDLCDFKSAQTSNLKKHIMAHTGEKPFKCDQCDFRTARSSHLKTHKMSHTGEMPFKCDQCEFKSAYSFVLKTHKKSHAGVMPYKCDLCEYASVRPFALKIHKMSHTGEKPFKCGQCDYKSAQSSNVRKHILLHDGDKIIRRGKPVKS